MAVKLSAPAPPPAAANISAAATTSATNSAVHEVGRALAQRRTADDYLTAYLAQLQTNPLRTKMITSGTLSGLQEVLASWIADDKSENGTYFSARVPKMTIYGAFIGAPLRHVLAYWSQRFFAGKTSRAAKVLQLLFDNLAVTSIQNIVYLMAMAVIAGARNSQQILATVKAGYVPIMRISLAVSTTAQVFAQQLLPPRVWAPFFNLVGLVVGTYFTTLAKKRKQAVAKKKAAAEEETKEVIDEKKEL